MAFEVSTRNSSSDEDETEIFSTLDSKDDMIIKYIESLTNNLEKIKNRNTCLKTKNKVLEDKVDLLSEGVRKKDE